MDADSTVTPSVSSEETKDVKAMELKMCPVCKAATTSIVCLLSKTVTDQRGIGFKGLICLDCGMIRVAKGRNGQFIFGYEEKWREQE